MATAYKLPAGTRFKTAAERRGERLSVGLPSLNARKWAGRATPGGFSRYARSSSTKVPAALLLFGLIVGIRVLRRGKLPAARETAGLLIASLVVAIAASFVPELVVAFLAALLIVVALDETPRIVAATNWVSELINPPAGRTGAFRPT